LKKGFHERNICDLGLPAGGPGGKGGLVSGIGLQKKEREGRGMHRQVGKSPKPTGLCLCQGVLEGEAKLFIFLPQKGTAGADRHSPWGNGKRGKKVSLLRVLNGNCKLGQKHMISRFLPLPGWAHRQLPKGAKFGGGGVSRGEGGVWKNTSQTVTLPCNGDREWKLCQCGVSGSYPAV